MKWQKRGLIYAPNGKNQWDRCGAHLPTVELLDGEIIRTYYASKDADGFGRIGYVDLADSDPLDILEVASDPALELGELGSFDDCGVVPNSVIEFTRRRHLYYQGFQRTERVPYLTFTGLAVANSRADQWEKVQRTPIMDRTDAEPFIRSTSCVIQVDDKLMMWYVSTIKWISDAKGVHYICVIRCAESCDGLNWQTHPHICLEPDLAHEYAVGRPAVVQDLDMYRMWYSIRSFTQFYTIGYAESADGVVWERKDALAGIGKSESGWDSEMICYPAIVDVKGKRLMFYNGNGRGVSGFGYAVLED